MSDIFANANTKVTPAYRGKTTLRKIDVMSDTLAASQALRAIDAREKAKEDEALTESAIQHDRAQALADGVTRKHMMESQLNIAIGRFGNEAKTYFLKDMLCDIYSKSLLLDKDFVVNHMAHIGKLISDYVDNNGGFTLLENAIKRTGSKLLTKIKTICEKSANTLCARKIKEATDTQDARFLTFDMLDSEKDEYENAKSEISPDEIADLVKDKVFTVIKDEKARQANEDEIRADIEAELNDSDDVTDEETAKEAVNSIMVNKIGVEETTLFNALLRNCCNEAIVESLNNADDDIPNLNSDMDVNTSVDDIQTGFIDDGENEIHSELNMDNVLSEAIAQYTLMEMLYTMKLEDYKPETLRQLSAKLIRPITK